jgi:seryl-tRNA synthetase
MLKENIEQSSYRLSFAEDKLLKQKEEILNLRNIKDKNEITSKRNISLNNENIKLRSIIEDKKANTKLVNELSKHKNKIEEQGSELSQLMKEYVKLEQEIKKTPKQATNSTNDIDNNIREIEFALERALTEKDFLESQFLELLDNHDEQLQLKDELKRTKTEYLMLEEHFIDLADKV